MFVDIPIKHEMFCHLGQENLEQAKPEFTLRKGRKFGFTFHVREHKLSCNKLLKVFNDSNKLLINIFNYTKAVNQKMLQCRIELFDYFTLLCKKGYEKNGALAKKNIFFRLIIKLISFFHRLERRRLLQQLNKDKLRLQRIAANINNDGPELFAHPTPDPSLLPFALGNLPEDILKHTIIPSLPLTDFLTFTATSPKYRTHDCLKLYLDHTTIDAQFKGIGCDVVYNGDEDIQNVGSLKFDKIDCLYNAIQTTLQDRTQTPTLRLLRLQTGLELLRIFNEINKLPADPFSGDCKIENKASLIKRNNFQGNWCLDAWAIVSFIRTGNITNALFHQELNRDAKGLELMAQTDHGDLKNAPLEYYLRNFLDTECILIDPYGSEPKSISIQFLKTIIRRVLNSFPQTAKGIE